MIKTIEAARIPNPVAKVLAVSLHLLLCIFHRLRGYTRPGTAPEHHPEAALNYDKTVVATWRSTLESVSSQATPFAGKNILELGPGPDLGNAVLLRCDGAENYTAVDVNPLALRAPLSFYDLLLRSLEHGKFDSDELKQEVQCALKGKPGKITYRVLPDFDLSNLEKNSFDLVLSQAAAEHFADPVQTISQLTPLIRESGWLLFQIDLKTHTPWLREIDPLSIYRIPNGLYQRTTYPGVPNRVRTPEYVAALQRNGFTKVSLIPQQVVSPQSVNHALPGLCAEFQRDPQEIAIMSCIVVAQKI